MRKDPNSVYLALDYEREKYASDRLRLREFNHKTQEWGRHVTPNQIGSLFSFDEDHDSSGCRGVYGTGDTTLSGAIHKIVEGVYGPRYRRRPYCGSRWGRFTFALREGFRTFSREGNRPPQNPLISIEYKGDDANDVLPALSYWIQKEIAPYGSKPFELDLNEAGGSFTTEFDYGVRAGHITFYFEGENSTKQSIEIEIYERVY